METKYLHTGFSVWIVSWLELQLGDAKFLEELCNYPDEITQGQISISNNTFDLDGK